MVSTTQTKPEIEIFYEDDDLIIVDKPANLLSQKDHSGDVDLTTLMKHYLLRNKRGSKTPYLGLLHRLDRPVSGLMMLAKNSRMASECSKMMNNQTIDKTYLAVVRGEASVNGYLEHFLIKDSQKNLVKVADQTSKHTQKAILTYQRRAYHPTKDLSLLAVHLVTGRSHQIRVQLAAEGLPIVNDQRYGSQADRLGHQAQPIALKSTELRFRQPITKKEIACQSLPDYKTQPWNSFEGELRNLLN